MSSDARLGHELRQTIAKSTPGQAGLVALSSLPPSLRPLVRAYVTGYATTVGPRLLAALVSHITRRRQEASAQASKGSRDSKEARETPAPLIAPVLHILKTGFEPQRFPTFCAVVAGGSTLLSKPLYVLLTRLLTVSGITRLRLARWISAFISAWLGLRLLQQKGSPSTPNNTNRNDGTAAKEASQHKPAARTGGHTLDLTLFTVARAVDVIVGELWSRHRARRTRAQRWTKGEEVISYLTDPSVFVVSCAFIMWSWFYYPSNLPRSYQKWITSAAMLDMRLIEALRRCKFGELRYGEDTGQASLLGPMCVDLDMPAAWGDPAKTIPYPCDVVHMKRGQSCERHALSRLVRSWKWSMYTYLPLALAFKVRKLEKRQLLKAFLSASRSSLFLGSFITIFYYTICLSRTRLGPHLNGTSTEACQRMDGGICVGMGCGMCGWSVLIETASRRKDMALFVAPRALATVLPRRYPLEKQYKETLAFAASAAVISTCVLENPRRVRGVFGRLLGSIMRT